MFKPLVSEALIDMLAVLGQGSCCSILMQLNKPRLRNELEITYNSDFLKSIRSLEKHKLIKKEEFMNEHIYSATDLGVFMQQVIQELEDKKYKIQGAKMIKNNKYSRKDYEELVKMPLDRKAQRLQTSILKIFRDAMPVLIKEEQTNTGYKLLGLIKNQYAAGGSFARSRKKSTKRISVKTIESNPEIFDEWSKAGCYNPKAIVQYPLAIWTKQEIEEYYEFMKKQG